MNQKTLNIIFVVILIVLLSLLVFLFVDREKGEKNNDDKIINKTQSTDVDNKKVDDQKIQENNDALKNESENLQQITMNCDHSLYSSNRALFDSWGKKFATLHPEFFNPYLGSYCELSDGNKLLSFAYFTDKKITTVNTGAQSVALFDKNDNLLKETKGLNCKTLGDVGAPKIQTLKDNTVVLDCSSGDAGIIITNIFLLNLSDFSFTQLEKSTERN